MMEDQNSFSSFLFLFLFLSLSLFLSLCRGTARRQLSASQEESPRTEFANTLILDFPASRPARNNAFVV